MSEVYKVVAPLVLIKDEAGRVNYAYENALVRLDEEQAERFLEEGLVEESDVELDDEEDGTQKPSRTAKNADLAEWIVANATKDDGSDYTAEELAGLTKANLLAIIDSLE
jgi:hypothetical protein